MEILNKYIYIPQIYIHNSIFNIHKYYIRLLLKSCCRKAILLTSSGTTINGCPSALIKIINCPSLKRNNNQIKSKPQLG